MMLVVACFGLSGCTSDPLTSYIHGQGFSPLVPPSNKMTLGDVYRSGDLQGAPVELVEDFLTTVEWHDLMDHAGRDVTLPSSENEKTYELTTEAYLIGRVSTELRAENVHRFRVSVENAKMYLISTGYFAREILPRLRAKQPALSGYYVYKLLAVERLEYEFFDKQGRKIDIVPDDHVSEIIRGRFGLEWSVNTRSNLQIDKMRFIGYAANPIPGAGEQQHASVAMDQAGRRAQIEQIVTSLRGVSDDYTASRIVIEELKSIKRPISGEELVAVMTAASISTDSVYVGVIDTVADQIEYPIATDTRKKLLASVVDDRLQARMLAALRRAEHH